MTTDDGSRDVLRPGQTPASIDATIGNSDDSLSVNDVQTTAPPEAADEALIQADRRNVARLMGYLSVSRNQPDDRRIPAVLTYAARLLKLHLADGQVVELAATLAPRSGDPADVLARAILAAVRERGTVEALPDEATILASDTSDEPFEVATFFSDPDDVGHAAYRALFLHLDEVAASWGDSFSLAMARAELDEVLLHARTIRAELAWQRPGDQPPFDFGSPSADDLRQAGWRVLMHRDARHDSAPDGRNYTVWTFQRAEDGKVIEVAGESDAAALDEMRWQLAAMPRWSYTLPDGEAQTIRALDRFDAAVQILSEEDVQITEFDPLAE